MFSGERLSSIFQSGHSGMKDTSVLSAQWAADALYMYLFNIDLESTSDQDGTVLSASQILTYLIYITIAGRLSSYSPLADEGTQAQRVGHSRSYDWQVSGCSSDTHHCASFPWEGEHPRHSEHC